MAKTHTPLPLGPEGIDPVGAVTLFHSGGGVLHTKGKDGKWDLIGKYKELIVSQMKNGAKKYAAMPSEPHKIIPPDATPQEKAVIAGWEAYHEKSKTGMVDPVEHHTEYWDYGWGAAHDGIIPDEVKDLWEGRIRWVKWPV